MLRTTPRIVCLLVGLTSAVGATTTSASSTSAPLSDGDQQIAGKQLMLKDSPEEAKGSLSSLSNDRTLTLGGGNGSAGDPTLFGGSVRVLTTTADRFDSTVVVATTSPEVLESLTKPFVGMLEWRSDLVLPAEQ